MSKKSQKNNVVAKTYVEEDEEPAFQLGFISTDVARTQLAERPPRDGRRVPRPSGVQYQRQSAPRHQGNMNLNNFPSL